MLFFTASRPTLGITWPLPSSHRMVFHPAVKNMEFKLKISPSSTGAVIPLPSVLPRHVSQSSTEKNLFELDPDLPSVISLVDFRIKV